MPSATPSESVVDRNSLVPDGEGFIDVMEIDSDASDGNAKNTSDSGVEDSKAELSNFPFLSILIE
jgi:hypothetical protein